VTATRLSPAPPAEAERHQRDELEACQQALAELRAEGARAAAGREALAAEVAALEGEVRALRRSARAASWSVTPSLPAELAPPFHVRPSRGGLAGRMRALLADEQRFTFLLVHLLCWTVASDRQARMAIFTTYVVSLLLAGTLLQGPEDDGAPSWSFGEDGLTECQGDPRVGRLRVRYADVLDVQVRRGLLGRLTGRGAVRVTHRVAKDATGREPKKPPTLEVASLDAPERLAAWLRARCHLPAEGARGG
jgi:hypothetical protein